MITFFNGMSNKVTMPLLLNALPILESFFHKISFCMCLFLFVKNFLLFEKIYGVVWAIIYIIIRCVN
jgi:hypothetical protein